MAKIYRRDNLVSGVTPKKKNEKNRKRSVIVNFRVTPEEKQLIDERIAAFLKPSSGRMNETIHSISNSIAYSPWRGTINTTTL